MALEQNTVSRSNWWRIPIVFVLLLAATTLLAQDKFKARLAPGPALGIPAASVVGIGSASASLSGRKLTVTGAFEKMASAATVAKLSLGVKAGVRGDPVFDLTVAKGPQSAPPGTSGTISGSFDLTPQQVDALRNGRFYIQIHSEGAPNGHLLGWLLK